MPWLLLNSSLLQTIIPAAAAAAAAAAVYAVNVTCYLHLFLITGYPSC